MSTIELTTRETSRTIPRIKKREGCKELWRKISLYGNDWGEGIV